MTRVDLYLLKGNTFSDQIDFCCRLTEKAFPQHPRIHIQTSESIQNEALNEALWSFKAESFLPHCVMNDGVMNDGVMNDGVMNDGVIDTKTAPITISTQTMMQDDNTEKNLLISLCPELPDNFQQFKRLCIIVLNIDTNIQHARVLYKQVKKQGLDVHIQDLRK